MDKKEKENIEEKEIMSKANKIILVLIIVATISLIIYLRFYWGGNSGIDIDLDLDIDIDFNSTETMECIANNSELYVSTTCSACHVQKLALGDYLDKFNVINCLDNAELCYENGIMKVPTWIIHGEKYSGVHQIDELLNLTGCGK